ncbi:MAG TPA: type II and III secretion system protein family protein [Candidatus Polarisedimenticolia bacterium]|jgi:pilus assembly protein CpaC|nr:type II and III secretion system protein family protein [Candidatus Polarisedimenticolia bacterium]
MKNIQRFPMRRFLVAILLAALLADGTTGPRAAAPPAAALPSPPNVLASLAAEGSRDGSGTRVTMQGNLPLSYSLAAPWEKPWYLTLNNVDPGKVGGELPVGTPQVDRIVVRSLSDAAGGPATRLEFQGGSADSRRVVVRGNSLIVELAGGQPAAVQPASPAPVAPPVPVAETRGYRPAELRSAAPVAAASPAPGPMDLTVAAGKSRTLDLSSPATRVSVTNPAIADAVVISPQQILINGIAPGSTSLLVWTRSGESRNYNLSVAMDTETLSGRLRDIFPDQQISVAASKDTLVLYGTVTKPEIGEKAVKVAADYSSKVVNNLTYPANGRRQIMLKVIFAEVNREAMTELSASLVRVDPNHPRGDHEGLSGTGVPGALGNWINRPQGPDFPFGEAINLYAFNFADKIGAFVTAMKTRGLLQVLAEPTLITADGQKASFLAGGEFPIPVAQAGAGFTSVTIIFKKFGISLDFTPEIREDQTIVLKVEPEVSSLDFANSVVLAGFSIPSLRVRRANTEVELKNGQSFAIAGLYSADLQQTKKKIPLLGDIPLLGYLFKSKNLNRNKSELLVIATPELVEPLPVGEKPALPKFDMTFDLDKTPKSKSGAPKSHAEVK